jgi:O-antigen/teichoic acid export membrane protein
MSDFKKIARNALANGAGFAVEAIIAFCMLPYIIHLIGESAYGIWTLTISLTGYMGILNLGLRPAINKYIAQYNILGEKEKMKELVQASLFCYMICAVIVLIASIVISLYANKIFNIPVEYKQAAPILFLLVGIQVSLGLVSVVYGGVISGLQRYDINNGIEISVMLSRTVIILCFLGRYPNIYTVAIAHFSMTIIGYILTVIIGIKISGINNIKITKLPTREILFTIFSFSVITFIIGIVGSIMSYIDSIIIGSLLTMTAVTYYTIGSRLVKYTQSLLGVLMNVLAPAASEMDAKGDKNIGQMYLFSSKVCAIVAFPILSFLIIQGKQFITLWVGANFADSYQIMVILCLGGLVVFPQLNAGPILYGLAKHRIIMWISIIEGIISVAVSIVLCKYLGVIGIAIGLAFPKAFLGGVVYPVYLSRLINLKWSDLITKCYLRAMVSTVPVATVLIISIFYLPSNSWLVFFSQLLGCVIIHACASWILGLTRDEKIEFKKLLIKIVNKLPISKMISIRNHNEY